MPRDFSPSQENATMNAAGRGRSRVDEVFCDRGRETRCRRSGGVCDD